MRLLCNSLLHKKKWSFVFICTIFFLIFFFLHALEHIQNSYKTLQRITDFKQIACSLMTNVALMKRVLVPVWTPQGHRLLPASIHTYGSGPLPSRCNRFLIHQKVHPSNPHHFREKDVVGDYANASQNTVRHPQPFPCPLMLSLHQGGSLSGPALMNLCCCFQSPPCPPCALAECLGDSVPWSSQRQRGGWLTSKSQCLPF